VKAFVRKVRQLFAVRSSVEAVMPGSFAHFPLGKALNPVTYSFNWSDCQGPITLNRRVGGSNPSQPTFEQKVPLENQPSEEIPR